MSEKFLLVSDLDDTLLGDSAALERFLAFYESLNPRFDIVYASGRFYHSVNDDIQNTSLPEPRAVVGGVGSEIRDYPTGELNQAWVHRITDHWNAATVRQVLSGEPRMELQPEQFQSDYKVSYFLRGASSEALDRLRAKLFDADINASIIYSSNRDLDFLPHGVNKGTAAAFLAHQWGFPADRVVVAGNSGNDAKLFEHDFRGIVVANAHDELKRLAADPEVYLSPHTHADGVRDGMQHWMQQVTA